MKDRLYDRLKWVSLILLPAIATLYFALGQIWHFPAVEEVVATITAVDTFLGLLLNRASSKYGPEMIGTVTVHQDQDGLVQGMTMTADRDPLILQEGRPIMFEVDRKQE